MPYKDPEKQKVAQRRSYERRKDKIKRVTQERRNELGQYKRERVRDLTAYVAAVKESSPCVDCGQHFHFAAMDYDHVRGAKRGSVAQLVAYGYSVASIDEEIAKCDLVCANCHRLRTWQRTKGKRAREAEWARLESV